MNVLLVLKKGRTTGVKVIVKLHTKSLREKAIALLKQDRKKEAFDLIVSRAMVAAYVREGIEPLIKPDLTLIEDA